MAPTPTEKQNMNNRTLIKIDDQNVWANADQVEAVATLLETRKGGVAAVEGYQPSSKDWITTPTMNVQFISRISYAKMMERKAAALATVSLADVKDAIAAEPKLSSLTGIEQRALFAEALNAELASIEKTQSGDRSDARRQASDRCFIRISDGIRIHLETEKRDGETHPVLMNGYPTIASILVEAHFLNTTYVVEGQRKVVNSRPLTLMKNAIRRAIDRPGVSFRSLSLKSDNFTSLKVDKRTILPEGLTA